jgi:hypothetical protein
MSNSIPVGMTRWGKHDVVIKMKNITDSPRKEGLKKSY